MSSSSTPPARNKGAAATPGGGSSNNGPSSSSSSSLQKQHRDRHNSAEEGEIVPSSLSTPRGPPLRGRPGSYASLGGGAPNNHIHKRGGLPFRSPARRSGPSFDWDSNNNNNNNAPPSSSQPPLTSSTSPFPPRGPPDRMGGGADFRPRGDGPPPPRHSHHHNNSHHHNPNNHHYHHRNSGGGPPIMRGGPPDRPSMRGPPPPRGSSGPPHNNEGGGNNMMMNHGHNRSFGDRDRGIMGGPRGSGGSLPDRSLSDRDLSRPRPLGGVARRASSYASLSAVMGPNDGLSPPTTKTQPPPRGDSYYGPLASPRSSNVTTTAAPTGSGGVVPTPNSSTAVNHHGSGQEKPWRKASEGGSSSSSGTPIMAPRHRATSEGGGLYHAKGARLLTSSHDSKPPSSQPRPSLDGPSLSPPPPQQQQQRKGSWSSLSGGRAPSESSLPLTSCTTPTMKSSSMSSNRHDVKHKSTSDSAVAAVGRERGLGMRDGTATAAAKDIMTTTTTTKPNTTILPSSTTSTTTTADVAQRPGKLGASVSTTMIPTGLDPPTHAAATAKLPPVAVSTVAMGGDDSSEEEGELLETSPAEIPSHATPTQPVVERRPQKVATITIRKTDTPPLQSFQSPNKVVDPRQPHTMDPRGSSVMGTSSEAHAPTTPVVATQSPAAPPAKPIPVPSPLTCASLGNTEKASKAELAVLKLSELVSKPSLNMSKEETSGALLLPTKQEILKGLSGLEMKLKKRQRETDQLKAEFKEAIMEEAVEKEKKKERMEKERLEEQLRLQRVEQALQNERQLKEEREKQKRRELQRKLDMEKEKKTEALERKVQEKRKEKEQSLQDLAKTEMERKEEELRKLKVTMKEKLQEAGEAWSGDLSKMRSVTEDALKNLTAGKFKAMETGAVFRSAADAVVAQKILAEEYASLQADGRDGVKDILQGGAAGPAEMNDLVSSILTQNQQSALEAQVNSLAFIPYAPPSPPDLTSEDDVSNKNEMNKGDEKTNEEWSNLARQVTGPVDALYIDVSKNPFYQQHAQQHDVLRPLVLEHVRAKKRKLKHRWEELSLEYMIRQQLYVDEHEASGKSLSDYGATQNKSAGVRSSILGGKSKPNRDVFNNDISGGSGGGGGVGGSSRSFRRQRRGIGNASTHSGLGSDVVRSEYEQEQIIAQLTAKDAMEKRIAFGGSKLPRQICQIERDTFVQYRESLNSHRVMDPLSLEMGKQHENIWCDIEKCIFLDRFLQHPKDFKKIASFLRSKTTKDCVAFYYDSKQSVPYKAALKEHIMRKKRRGDGVWEATIQAALSVGAVVTAGSNADKPVTFSLPVDDNTYHTRYFHPLRRELFVGALLELDPLEVDEDAVEGRRPPNTVRNLFSLDSSERKFLKTAPCDSVSSHKRKHETGESGDRVEKVPKSSSASNVREAIQTKTAVLSADASIDTTSGSSAAANMLRKAPQKWTQAERKAFFDCVQQHGKNWKVLVEAVGSKSISQIKNYYYDHKKQFGKTQQNGSDDTDLGEKGALSGMNDGSYTGQGKYSNQKEHGGEAIGRSLMEDRRMSIPENQEAWEAITSNQAPLRQMAQKTVFDRVQHSDNEHNPQQVVGDDIDNAGRFLGTRRPSSASSQGAYDAWQQQQQRLSPMTESQLQHLQQQQAHVLHLQQQQQLQQNQQHQQRNLMSQQQQQQTQQHNHAHQQVISNLNTTLPWMTAHVQAQAAALQNRQHQHQSQHHQQLRQQELAAAQLQIANIAMALRQAAAAGHTNVGFPSGTSGLGALAGLAAAQQGRPMPADSDLALHAAAVAHMNSGNGGGGPSMSNNSGHPHHSNNNQHHQQQQQQQQHILSQHVGNTMHQHHSQQHQASSSHAAGALELLARAIPRGDSMPSSAGNSQHNGNGYNMDSNTHPHHHHHHGRDDRNQL